MPDNRFLYEHLDSLWRFGQIKREVPASIPRNLNPNLPLRPCQEDAFARFAFCMENDFEGTHFLFHMATGSGKTLVMAGLILWLYEKGWRNFLFVVDKTNILEKTRENFLNPSSSKHLFARSIAFGDRRVQLTAVDNFDAANRNDINLLFTTIQGLHSRITTEKENSVSLEDFRRHKIALIADEAHHFNAATRQQLELGKPTWENTVQNILSQNEENLLLEFTATPGYERNAELQEKYRNKTIIRYDLARFRRDRYSKDVILARSDFHLDERMLQAAVLSQYRRETAAKRRLNLKPVILFKSRTIKESADSKALFHSVMENLDGEKITALRRSDMPVIRRAFEFFKKTNTSDGELANRLRSEFHEDFCLSANNEKAMAENQILLNSLEDKNNRIRAVFAVQKLSEGWDVLNLFDIVRCHENRNSKTGKGNTAEAQLIGRGARYFPFVLPDNDDRYRRKFDGDPGNELRVLEEMHYHSKNDVRYISELRKALVKEGSLDEEEIERQIQLKESFKKTPLYKYGVVWLNEKKRRDYGRIQSFAALRVAQRNHHHTLASGSGGEEPAFGGGGRRGTGGGNSQWDEKVSTFPRGVVESALARNSFFEFNHLRKFFPALASMRDFAASDNYLGGLSITFSGDKGKQSPREQLSALGGLLREIASDIHAQHSEFEGTREFKPRPMRKVFTEKTLRFSADNPRAQADDAFNRIVAEESWFGFDSAYCTSEEKNLVHLLSRKIPEMRERHDSIYLLRNEGHFTLYNFADGRGFEPDFAMFLRDKKGKTLVYQIFLEPKGEIFQENDRWKAEFLDDITAEFKGKTIAGDGKRFRLIGLPFYSSKKENDFMEKLDAALAKPDADSAKN